MGMEGQIMCVDFMHILDVISSFLGPQNAPKSLASGAPPQTTPAELTALPQTSQLGLRGPTSKAFTSKGRGGEGRGGSQNDLCPRGQNPSRLQGGV